MKKITVGVTGINAVDNPGPGVGVARSLKEAEGLHVKVIGLAYDAMEPGIYLDWLIDSSFMMPYPSGGKDAYMQRLGYIAEKTGLNFIIPSLDAELPFYTKYADELKEMGIGTMVPSLDQFKLRGKDRLANVADDMGLKIPKTEVVTTYEDMTRALNTMEFPVMVKGAFYKAYRANTTQEAFNCYGKIVAEWGYPVIVQQVVTGEEMNVVGVGDGEGGNLGMMGLKKMWVTSLGKIWTGVSVANEQMLDAADRFVKNVNWRGPFELECMVSSDDVYLIEINPRFPAWSYFSTGVGINMPANLVRSYLDMETPKNQEYESGKLYVRYTYEVVTEMDSFRAMMTNGECTNESDL